MNSILVSMLALFLFGSASGQDQPEGTPRFVLERRLAMEQNHPEPFYTDEETNIAYKAIGAITVSLIVVDAHGKKVWTLNQLPEESGVIRINGQELLPGVYRYALIVNGRRIFVKNMTVLKK